MLQKTYLFSGVEEKIYKKWQASGAMKAKRHSEKSPYTLMMPPPNVTGVLHLGHALTFTLQDIIIRYQRMQGKDVLWQPGMDHAGISTQMVVERQLDQQKETRQQLGREAFIQRVWEWKERSGGIINQQLRRLGATPDWTRERFTFDEGLSCSVHKVFVDLYRQGLIYRDKRLVNWDPHLETAISDIEVENQEIQGKMWHFKYPIDGLKDTFINIATTRPETMFGDTAVAVHPDDKRYQDLIGKLVKLPLDGRLIPIIADDYANPEKGTGAVKITPAHDFNDFEVGKRHKLPLINIFNKNACLNDAVPKAYQELDRLMAREKIVDEMRRLGLLISVEEMMVSIPHAERSGAIVEPWLMSQWYVDAATLAQPALRAVEEGRTRFVPENWTKTYFDWLKNIQPWCISRQIWWGHRIPAWYGPDGKIFVAMSEGEALIDAQRFYGCDDVLLTQDEDVLDTWFSSALWPFSTLGWPDETEELKRYYPTDLLITGHDIIFFWVARMMMMGLHFIKEVPFKTVYMHALIRDEKGQKMSKSKGNVSDPLELMDIYGADALRFTLASLTVPGRDIKFSPSQVEGNRNFVTKLWNAARFCEMNQCKYDSNFRPEQVKSLLNQWITVEVNLLVRKVNQDIAEFKFSEVAGKLYHFIWGTFCDWYLELCKPIFFEENVEKIETQKTVAWVLKLILQLLHPIMPYVTEELWDNFYPTSSGCLMETTWPKEDFVLHHNVVSGQHDIQWLIKTISEVRKIRAEVNIPHSQQLILKFYDAGPETHRRARDLQVLLMRMGRIEHIEVLSESISSQEVKGSLQSMVDEATMVLPLGNIINLKEEKERLIKELTKAEEEIKKIEKKLQNKNFIDKAPQEVVEVQQKRLDEAQLLKVKLSQALEKITL